MSTILLVLFILLSFGGMMFIMISWRLYFEQVLSDIEAEGREKGIPVPHELKEKWIIFGVPRKQDYPLLEAINPEKLQEFKRRLVRVRKQQLLLLLLAFGLIILRNCYFG